MSLETRAIDRSRTTKKRLTAHPRYAFTIVELMVAVAIIALLISIMIPGFSAVRNSANIVATQSLFQGLGAGLESYRGERALGGVYPPSRSDHNNSSLFINNPFNTTSTLMVGITGAHLLAFGLVGADQLGTPGFPDLDGDGSWHNDQGANKTANYKAAYALDDETNEPLTTRYPGGGATYVDETTRGSLRSLRQIYDDGASVTDPEEPAFPYKPVAEHRTFTDRWGHPVLYYRANRAGRTMIKGSGASGNPGIYNLQDNALITGYVDADFPMNGIDFGPGLVGVRRDFYSEIALSEYPRLRPEFSGGENQILVDANYERTFERFILDRSVTAQNRPVNARSYLLISAGADAVYGTSDDVTNWEHAE